MHKSLLRDLLLLMTVGGCLLVGGYFIAKKIWDSDTDLSFKISYEQENKLGGIFNDMILNQYKVIENNAADSALHIRCHRRQTPLRPSPTPSRDDTPRKE